MTSAVVSSIRLRQYDEDPLKDQSGSRHLPQPYYADYHVTIHPKDVVITKSLSSRRSRFIHAPVRVIRELFLPVGFPTSVEDGYLEYQFYDSLQGLCSYLRGVLCSAQVLHAAGVGKLGASAMGAAMTWALKDGLSMLGGLLFSYEYAPRFDAYVKEFRFFADIINDIGLTLDMMTPYLAKQTNLLFITSISGLCKTICGLTAGATKSSITQHFALEGNMADLNAKEAAQETLVSLVGMGLGVVFAHVLTEMGEHRHYNAETKHHVMWAVFAFLTLLHIWANWMGVRVLRLRTLNRERAKVAFKGVVDVLVAASLAANAASDSSSMNITAEMQPEHLALISQRLKTSIDAIPPPSKLRESLFASTFNMLLPSNIHLTSSLVELLKCGSEGGGGRTLLDTYQDERYLLALDNKKAKHNIYIVLLIGATSSDQIQAYLHALVLDRYLQERSKLRSVAATAASKLGGSGPTAKELVLETRQIVKLLFADKDIEGGLKAHALVSSLTEKKWDLERVYFGFCRTRIQFTEQKYD